MTKMRDILHDFAGEVEEIVLSTLTDSERRTQLLASALDTYLEDIKERIVG